MSEKLESFLKEIVHLQRESFWEGMEVDCNQWSACKSREKLRQLLKEELNAGLTGKQLTRRKRRKPVVTIH